jgi:hypothetical protein
VLVYSVSGGSRLTHQPPMHGWVLALNKEHWASRLPEVPLRDRLARLVSGCQPETPAQQGFRGLSKAKLCKLAQPQARPFTFYPA